MSPLPGSTLVNPKLNTHLEKVGWYPDKVTIQENFPSRANPFNQPKPSWSDLAGHVALPCALSTGAAVRSWGRRGEEVRSSAQTYIESDGVCFLRDYKPLIRDVMRVVVVSGSAFPPTTEFDIIAVEHDAVEQTTIMWMRRIEEPKETEA